MLIITKRRIRHNGELHAVGAEIEMETKDVNLLPKDSYAVVSESDWFYEAISMLDPENEKHWTGEGKPDANALSSVCDKKISASERDELWAKYQDMM